MSKLGLTDEEVTEFAVKLFACDIGCGEPTFHDVESELKSMLRPQRERIVAALREEQKRLRRPGGQDMTVQDRSQTAIRVLGDLIDRLESSDG